MCIIKAPQYHTCWIHMVNVFDMETNCWKNSFYKLLDSLCLCAHTDFFFSFFVRFWFFLFHIFFFFFFLRLQISVCLEQEQVCTSGVFFFNKFVCSLHFNRNNKTTPVTRKKKIIEAPTTLLILMWKRLPIVSNQISNKCLSNPVNSNDYQMWIISYRINRSEAEAIHFYRNLQSTHHCTYKLITASLSLLYTIFARYTTKKPPSHLITYKNG